MAAQKRLEHLDVARGIAILGILIINIQSFSQPSTMFINPTLEGGLEGRQYVYWLLSHLLADDKFISTLSILFGCGLCLLWTRYDRDFTSFRKIWQRRMLCLGAIGLLHSLLLWHGDILFSYAVCGYLALFFLTMPSRRLALVILAFLMVPLAISYFIAGAIQLAPGAVFPFIEQSMWKPATGVLADDIRQYQGPWWEMTGDRITKTLQLQTWMLLRENLWRTTGLMLLGVLLYRARFLLGAWRDSTYRRVFLRAFAIGIGLGLLGVAVYEMTDWSMLSWLFYARVYNYFGSIVMALGWLALAVYIARAQHMKWVAFGLSHVGRLALTNYLMQSVICGFIFYGYGLGLYGQLTRGQLWLIVLAVWAVQIAMSILWNRFFLMGPVEWAWRSTADGRIMAFRKQQRPAPARS